MRLIVPIDLLFVAVELHFFGHSCLTEGIEDDLLLGWWEQIVASSALKVGVAGEVADADGHEFLVLRRVHPLLEIGEAASVGYGGVVAIVWAGVCLCALSGIDKA